MPVISGQSATISGIPPPQRSHAPARQYPIRILMAAILCLAVSPAFAWRVSTDFESGILDTLVANDVIEGFTGTTYSNVQSFSGSQSARLEILEGTDGWEHWGIEVNHPTLLEQYDEVWLRIHAFFPDGFNFVADPWLKFLRVQTLDREFDNAGYVDWYIDEPPDPTPYRWIYEGQQLWNTFGTQNDMIQTGIWETYEMYIKFDTVPVSKGGQAIVRIWKNGRLLKEITDGVTLSEPAGVSQRTLIFTFWNGGAPATQHMYLDDLVLTNETPCGRDLFGNPMIGTGTGIAAPCPPTNITVE